MNKTVYQDGKYCMQDVGSIYLGTKYTKEELLEEEEVNFKLRMIMDRYLLANCDPEDTLETHLYYLDRKDFNSKIYKQLHAKVKVNVLEQKKGAFGKEGSLVYTTKQMTVEELSAILPKDKEKMGMVVQELAVSKFALMGF